MKDNKKYLTPIEDLITEDFGAVGTPRRDQFEMECDAFIIDEQLKEERRKAGLTQEQLADKIGTKKNYSAVWASKLEFGFFEQKHRFLPISAKNGRYLDVFWRIFADIGKNKARRKAG